MGSESRSKKLRNCNMVQPMGLTSPSMTDSRNKMENPRLTQHKRRKTNQKVDRVGSGSRSRQDRNNNIVQLTDSSGQSITEDGSSDGSNREAIPSKWPN